MPPAFIDFETRSVADLKSVGLWKYAWHPSTDILCLGWALGDERPKLWRPEEGLVPLARLLDHVVSGGTVVAHNAAFELTLWRAVLRREFPEAPALKPEQTVCTMARAYAMGLPGSLENAALALGLPAKKDSKGHALMLRMCKPTNPNEVMRGADPAWVTDETEFTFDGQKRTPKWALKRLGSYCLQDVVVEREVYRRTRALSSSEQRVWLFDRAVNTRGTCFDLPAVRGALELREQTLARLDKQMKLVTAGAVQSCNALAALKAWAADYGVFEDSLAADVLDALLDRPGLPAEVRRAFELRREAGRATSVAKLKTIERLADAHGRVRETTQYHGAATGRFAGRMIQPHNFPRDLPPPEEVEDVMRRLRKGKPLPEDKPALTTISQLLRGFIVPGAGRRFIGGDFSNIEGRMLAWLAGESWKVKAFREADKDPELDIYKQSYAAAFNVLARNVSGEQRQLGKVMELALGYAGGVGAFQTMARAFKMDVPDGRADELKLLWRERHPRTVRYWHAMEDAAKSAVIRKGHERTVGPPHARITFRMNGSFLWMQLPSGRLLCYPYPKMVETDFGPALSYKTAPDALKWGAFKKAKDEKRLEGYTGPIVDEPGNTRSWARQTTYGGKLVENATQAAARDLFVAAMMRLERNGLPVVLHIHDEIVVEGKFQERDRERAQRLMCRVPAWARGLPVAAECWLGERYQK